MIEEKQVTTEENQESDNSQEHNGQESDDEIRADIHRKLTSPFNHIDKADPTKIQCVAAASLELNEKYHDSILQQNRQSFCIAIVTACLGFLLFTLSVVFFAQHLTNFALITTTGSAIAAILLGTTFYLYRHTLSSFEVIHQCLARTELLLIGNSLCTQIKDQEKRTAAYMELIRNVTQLTVLISKDEHKRDQ